MKRRRTTVALLFDSLVSEYTVSLRRAVERAATANDVSVLVVMGQAVADPVAAAVTQNQIYELIGAKRVDGVIVCSATVGHYCGTNGLVEFCRAYAPLPVCSIGVDLPGIPSVIIDNEGGMRLGVEHLIDVHDARRLVFIGGPEASVESNLRLAGYQKALEGRGLPFERELVVHGGFTVPTGAAAMRAVLDAGVAFDAVVAANDDMALGALDVLKQAGLNVPRDIPIFGFDDIDSAHYARPPLSTLRQPLWWLGERAIQNILGQLRGEQVPALSIGPVDFVRRESCGCGYQVNATDHPQGDEWPNLREVLRSRRDALAVALRAAASTPNAALGDWPSLLLDALAHDLGGAEGHFSAVFEDLLERAQREGASLDEFQRVVSVLRSELRRARVRDEDGPRRLEHIWHNARVLVGAASIRFLGRQKLEQQYATSGLSLVGERLATTLSLPLLRDELVDGLPRLGIDRGAVALYTGPRSGALKLLAARVETEALAASNDEFPDTDLAPSTILETEACTHFVVLPITFETEMLGVAVLAGGAKPSIYEGLRQLIGSAVKSAMIHREMVAQVTLRAQLEAERLEKESRIAAEIQTGMNPAVLEVPGLELAALMAPAAEAGGDYYDVISTPKGAWLGIGDVTGHGLASGLIMLMIQSMVAGFARMEPAPSPSQVVAAVGEALWDNVRQRLERDDHATLTVFRYHGRGRFTFAGAHEDFIVWRAKTARCETIQTPGFWVGALPSVRRMTRDSELSLETGDLLVLYTDGVTEARNTRHEQFSLERLMRLIEDSATRPVSAIRDAVHQAVTAWSASLDDDMTVLIVRYVGE